jgi:hypothetical protein
MIYNRCGLYETKGLPGVCIQQDKCDDFSLEGPTAKEMAMPERKYVVNLNSESYVFDNQAEALSFMTLAMNSQRAHRKYTDKYTYGFSGTDHDLSLEIINLNRIKQVEEN